MNRRINIIAAVALGCVAAVACAQAPQEDVSAAQAEVDKARQAQADTWAPNEFQAADQAMKAAQDEIQAQNAKWMKNYDKAKELLPRAGVLFLAPVRTSRSRDSLCRTRSSPRGGRVRSRCGVHSGAARRHGNGARRDGAGRRGRRSGARPRAVRRGPLGAGESRGGGARAVA